MNEPEIYNYCIESSEKEPDYLIQLRRATHLRALRPQMLSGPLQGQLLKLLIKLFKSEKVLEIGTFTGYATLCMAAGLPEKGIVHTIEIEEEFSWFHGQFFKKSGLEERIKCHYGDANDIIPEINETFDFVFMDAGKKDYKNQLEVLISKMQCGGIILADNVLWKGKVAKPNTEFDKMTRQIHEFNVFVNDHPQLENVILPIRDGLNLIRIL